MSTQVFLTDVFASTERKLGWVDTNIAEHRSYLTRLEQTAELLDGRTDHAGRWALDQVEHEITHVHAALAGVPSIEAEREAWRAALAECDDAQRAVDGAKTVTTLIEAQAASSLAQRASGAAFEKFRDAAHASRLPSPNERALHSAWRDALAAIEDLTRHAASLDDFTPGGVTFTQSAAFDCARGHAANAALAALPFIVARTQPTSRTFRLFWHFAAKRHGIDGAETYTQIFAKGKAA
jgi:hypothetical protein